MLVKKKHSLNGSDKNAGDNDTSEENGKRGGNFVKDVSRTNQIMNVELEPKGSLQLTAIHVFTGHVPYT